RPLGHGRRARLAPWRPPASAALESHCPRTRAAAAGQAARADHNASPAGAAQRRHLAPQSGLAGLRSRAARGGDHHRGLDRELGGRARLPAGAGRECAGVSLARRAALAAEPRPAPADARAGGAGHVGADADAEPGRPGGSRRAGPRFRHHRREGQLRRRRPRAPPVVAASPGWPSARAVARRRHECDPIAEWCSRAARARGRYAMNRALLAVGLAVMGVCWVYPWSLLVAVWTATSELLSPPTMLTLVLLAAASTQVAMRSLHTRKRGQATVIALGLAASLVAVRVDHYPQAGAFDWLPELAEALAGLLGHPTAPAIALFVALLLWRRGAQLASDTPTFLDLEAAFRWSIGALVCFAVALALAIRPSQQPAIEARATPFVVGSFFVALLTLALARLESLRTRTQALALNTQWLGVLIAVAGLLVLA